MKQISFEGCQRGCKHLDRFREKAYRQKEFERWYTAKTEEGKWIKSMI